VNLPTLVGSAGVTLLLIAFALNIIRYIREDSTAYLTMNVTGSFMAAWYAWAGNSMPFLVLEIVWGMVAAVKLGLVIKKGSR
jgi:hypothetical protein